MWGSGSVWGEGLVDDSWSQVACVDRWDVVHPDEMLRLFPALVGTAGRSALLIGQLEQAVAVCWRRLRGRPGSHHPYLASLDANALATLAAAHEARWFPVPRALQSAMDRLLGAKAGLAASSLGDEAALFALDDLLDALRTGRAVAYSEHRALGLAFHAGIHPAYVWREALALHDGAAAIGWLGVVARGREALLPPDIAAFLAEGIAGNPDGTGRPRDPRFALCGLTPLQWGSIGRAARLCLEGKRETVRLRHATPPAMGRAAPSLTARVLQRFVMGAMTATRAKRRAS